MAVLAVLAPVFFPGHAALVAWGLVGLNLAILAALGLLLHRRVLGARHLPFIMEMPLYHVPNPRTLVRIVWRRTVAFVRNAGSIILVGADRRVGALEAPARRRRDELPRGRRAGPVAGRVAAGARLANDDGALLSSFIAKENAIATLGVLYQAAGSERTLGELIAASMTPAAGLAMMVVQMLFIPCLATVATLRTELGAWRWIVAEIAVLIAVSIGVGAVVYRLALALGLG